MEAVTGANASASHLSSIFQSAIDGAAGSLGATVKLDLSRGSPTDAAFGGISSKHSLLTGLEDIALWPARALVGVSPALQPTSAAMHSLGLGWTAHLLESMWGLDRFDSMLSGIVGSLNIADVWAKAIPFPFFPEGTDPGDLERLRSRRLDDAERYAAAQRMAARTPWDTKRRPGVYPALAARAEAEQRFVSDVMREELATAIYLAAADSAKPQYVRFGQEWLIDEAGERVQVVPDELPLEYFSRWLYGRAIRLAEAAVLGYPEKAALVELADDMPELALPNEDPLVIVVAREADSLLAGLTPESDPRLQRLLTVATEQQWQLLRLIEAGMTRADAARALGISPSTARVQFGRLRKALA